MENPTGNNLEKELVQLGREVSEKRNLPKHKDLSERELIKKSLEPVIKQMPTGAPISGQPVQVDGQASPDDLNNLPAEAKIKVEKLINLVFNDGLMSGVKEAQKSDAFVLDAFHDALTDKFYEELKKRKLI